MDMNKAVKLSLSLSLSHLEDTHGVFKTVVESNEMGILKPQTVLKRRLLLPILCDHVKLLL